MRRGNRMSSRQRFFQEHIFEDNCADVFKDQTEIESIPMYGSTSDGYATTSGFGPANTLCSRKRLFEELHNEDDDTHTSEQLDADNVLENLSSFGQALYQSQHQGIFVGYKDLGDNSFQCIHCNAYHWRDEKNRRGVYTGCCKGGQVRLQPSKPTPTFLEHLLDPNNGAKGRLGMKLLKNDFYVYTL